MHVFTMHNIFLWELSNTQYIGKGNFTILFQNWCCHRKCEVALISFDNCFFMKNICLTKFLLCTADKLINMFTCNSPICIYCCEYVTIHQQIPWLSHSIYYFYHIKLHIYILYWTNQHSCWGQTLSHTPI